MDELRFEPIGVQSCSQDLKVADRVLCLIWGPFQLFALLCLLLDEEGAMNGNLDLVFINRFPRVEEYTNKLMALGMFDNVYYPEEVYPVYKHAGFKYVIDAILNQRAMRARFEEEFPVLAGKEYDVLISSFPDYPVLAAKLLFVPHGATCFIDDGAGSHTDGSFTAFGCFDEWAVSQARPDTLYGHLKLFLKRIALTILPDAAKLNIMEYRLFSPDEALRHLYGGMEVRDLHVPSDMGLINSIMAPDFDPSMWQDAKIVFLTLSGNAPQAMLERERELLDLLEAHTSNQILIRLHPLRSTEDFSAYSNRILPDDNWEISIANGMISDETVLISWCSTALLTPSVVFGIYPKLIITARLFSLNDYAKHATAQLIESVNRGYEGRGTVIVPKTPSELLTSLVI